MPRRRPPEPFVFFVDECLGAEDLASALASAVDAAAGETVKTLPSGALDEEWLPSAGRDGWIVISKDRAMLRRENHLAAILDHGVALVTVGEANGREHARRIVGALPTVRRVARTTDVAFIARISSDCSMEITYEASEKLPRARAIKQKIRERGK